MPPPRTPRVARPDAPGALFHAPIRGARSATPAALEAAPSGPVVLR